MLFILIYWVVLSVSFWGWGRMLGSYFGSASVRQDFSETGYFFMGISVVGLLASVLWIFMPLNHMVGGFFVGAGFGYAIACLPVSPEINFRNPWFAFSSFCFLLALLQKSAAPTSFYDCGLYYTQTLRWVQQYAVVPGLGNLHIRFGNASAWHILSALLDINGPLGPHFDGLGELLLLWFLIFHCWNSLKLQGFERYLSLSLVAFALVLAYPLLSSPSPDLAAGVLGMQTLWQFRKFLRAWNPKEPNQLNTRGLALFFQSLFLFQIKLSSAPFFVVAVLILFLIARERWYKTVALLLAFGASFMLSLFCRSYILTGYVLFPIVDGGLKPDWKLWPADVQFYLDGVRGFARHRLTLPEVGKGWTYESLGRLSFSEWFPLWVSDRSLFDWFIILSAVCGWLLLVRYASSQVRKSFLNHWPLIFFTWLSGMMLLFWFSNAPDIRFGMAVLGIGFSFTTASLLNGLRPKIYSGNSKWFPSLLMVVLAFMSVVFYRDMRPWQAARWVETPYPKVEIDHTEGPNGLFYFPKNRGEVPIPDQCWDAPLPCGPHFDPDLQYRSSQLKDGFKKRSL